MICLGLINKAVCGTSLDYPPSKFLCPWSHYSQEKSLETARPWNPEAGKLLDRPLGLQANLSLDLVQPLPGCLTLDRGDVDNNQPHETIAN